MSKFQTETTPFDVRQRIEKLQRIADLGQVFTVLGFGNPAQPDAVAVMPVGVGNAVVFNVERPRPGMHR